MAAKKKLDKVVEEKKISKSEDAEIKAEAKPEIKVSERASPDTEKPKTKAKAKKAKAPATEKIEVAVKPEAIHTEKAAAEEEPKTIKKEEEKTKFDFKAFGRWDMNVVVADMGLKEYISLPSQLVPFSAGRTAHKQFWKSKKNIIERLIGKIMVSGHKGKKHFRTSGHQTGKYLTISRIVREVFEIIEKKTGKNPVQVYIDAIVHGSPKEGITTIEYGGVRYPKSVDLSPQRRIDLVLRWLTQGAYAKSSGSRGKINFKTALADELMYAASSDAKSSIISKRTELERQASASR